MKLPPTEADIARVQQWLMGDANGKGLVLLGVSLDEWAPLLQKLRPKWSSVELWGCTAKDRKLARVLRSQYVQDHRQENSEFNSCPPAAYTSDDYLLGFDGDIRNTRDHEIFEFYKRGQELPTLSDHFSQMQHDVVMSHHLSNYLECWGANGGRPPLGTMGGHALKRGTLAYEEMARSARKQARAGYLVATGGGPGAMEAVNLGAYFSPFPDGALDDALKMLASAPDFNQNSYTSASVAVLERYPRRETGNPRKDMVMGGIGIPTWHYGHEPANLFAHRSFKYFDNDLREGNLIRASSGALIVAPGAAGTVQEVFQHSTGQFYNPAPEGGPAEIFFFNSEFWEKEENRSVVDRCRWQMATAKGGNFAHHVHETNDPDEIIEIMNGRPAIPLAMRRPRQLESCLVVDKAFFDAAIDSLDTKLPRRRWRRRAMGRPHSARWGHPEARASVPREVLAERKDSTHALRGPSITSARSPEKKVWRPK